MRQTNARPPRQLAWLEQIAVLATSLVWTAIVLLIISFFWAYQDAQARWETFQSQPTSMAVAMLPSDLSTPSAVPPPPTETATLTASPTPAPTNSPTPTPTYVIGPAGVPEILPETPLEGEATPAVVPDEGNTPEPVVSPTHTPVPPTHTPTPVANTPVPPLPPPATPGESGPPTRIVIKSVGIDTPVVPVGWSIVEQNGRQYSVWDVADYAGGWHKTSALPGQPGNTVISGHHNIKGEVFRYLVDVQEGDQVDVYVGDTVYRYYVQQKLIVKEKGEAVEVRKQNAQWIAPTDDTRVTLVTCWPYTNNTHRVIVVARPGS
jgi:LPXTG-site transpeptidase (sortase) family protein